MSAFDAVEHALRELDAAVSDEHGQVTALIDALKHPKADVVAGALLVQNYQPHRYIFYPR